MRMDMSSAEQKIAELEEQLGEARRESLGLQEMMAFVLKAIGEDVVVPKSLVKEGIEAGVQIKVDDNATLDAFVFGLTEVTE